MSDPSIDSLRARIDECDLEILRLLGERARSAVEIGRIKSRAGLPVYDPERERRLLARLRGRNRGPLTGDAVVRVFERIIDESRRLEREGL